MTRVIDGDTVEVDARIWLDQTIRVSVRLDGLDAPEIRYADCATEKALGNAAKVFLRERLAGQDVVLHGVKEGKYAGRVVARIKTPSGDEPALALLDEGLASPQPRRGKGRDWCDQAAQDVEARLSAAQADFEARPERSFARLETDAAPDVPARSFGRAFAQQR
ncbi:MAG: thermonuclease family protein [Pseudomonadota bacterium]